MATTLGKLELTDLADPVMFANPYPRYAELRRNAPISRVRSKQLLRGREGYLLVRHEDVLQVHTDKRFSNDAIAPSGLSAKMIPRLFRLLADSMVFTDDPDHRRLRKLVSRTFTPRMVQRMSEDIDRIVDELVERLAARSDVDLVADFATPLPLSVIADMLGINDRDRDEFHHRVSAFTEGAVGSPLEVLRQLPNGRKLIRLFERLAEERRTEPDDRLISALVQVNGDDGDKLGDEELLAMIFLLLLAGHDTTANLIGSGILALLDNPDQLAWLRANPDQIDTAVEELLRYTTPVPCGGPRRALEDLEVGGVTLPQGSYVLGMIISGNRDETVFAEPESLDLSRADNPHIAFGQGAHYCLGHQLARMEGRAAIRALVTRFDRIELTVPRESLDYKRTQSLRGLTSLPLRLS